MSSWPDESETPSPHGVRSPWLRTLKRRVGLITMIVAAFIALTLVSMGISAAINDSKRDLYTVAFEAHVAALAGEAEAETELWAAQYEWVEAWNSITEKEGLSAQATRASSTDDKIIAQKPQHGLTELAESLALVTATPPPARPVISCPDTQALQGHEAYADALKEAPSEIPTVSPQDPPFKTVEEGADYRTDARLVVEDATADVIARTEEVTEQTEEARTEAEAVEALLAHNGKAVSAAAKSAIDQAAAWKKAHPVADAKAFDMAFHALTTAAEDQDPADTLAALSAYVVQAEELKKAPRA